MKPVLPVIVISQFFCTSVWFAGNAIMNDIAREINLSNGYLAHLTTAVQLGFILGTFIFALFSVADRWSPSVVFMWSACAAALLNWVVAVVPLGIASLLGLRLLTGFFLAGIYPVGMKIASDYFSGGLGKSLGFLVGALVLGTAFPHFLKTITVSFPWRYVVYTTSILSAAGGVLIYLLVPDGPYRKAGQKPSIAAFLKGFSHSGFRSAAFGYFGHMWELYAFWTFVPLMLSTHAKLNPAVSINIPLLSFLIIAVGSFGCLLAGYLAQNGKEKLVAGSFLFVSGTCCLLSPVMLQWASLPVFLVFMIIWGISVVADSPMFSTLVAKSADPETRAASLTIVNCIGFAITIISIQLLNVLSRLLLSEYIYLFMAIGPLVGLFALLRRQPAADPSIKLPSGS